MAAQKKTGSAIANLTLLLNPCDSRKSQGEITETFLWWQPYRLLALVFLAGDTLGSTIHLHRNGRRDRWMRIVADKFEIFEFEIVNAFDCWVQFHPWQRPTITRKLFASFVEMVLVKMQIAKGMNEFCRAKIAHLRNH